MIAWIARELYILFWPAKVVPLCSHMKIHKSAVYINKYVETTYATFDLSISLRYVSHSDNVRYGKIIMYITCSTPRKRLR
jgi:hypothetical protein